MNRLLLWIFLIVGFILLYYSFKQSPRKKESLIVFLLTAYIDSFLGTLVVGANLVQYPVKFLSQYFSSSILFEYLLLPVVAVYLYKRTYQSTFTEMILHTALYTTLLTIIEVSFERYTDLIKYQDWSWLFTFTGEFILLILIRSFMRLINK
ncbi:CBO0543 family protein [Tuberibacillus sp. Marseille-P3662]|uniref:CBO0543 family protein n=1 Tax=Tuberibacillus sp. Marseille-P3662 TaxID=1965358 RepID=UPI000A1C818A|nr:CBO0543 family protein [Tuberibacillus sp. Marseille-P3662]